MVPDTWSRAWYLVRSSQDKAFSIPYSLFSAL